MSSSLDNDAAIRGRNRIDIGVEGCRIDVGVVGGIFSKASKNCEGLLSSCGLLIPAILYA